MSMRVTLPSPRRVPEISRMPINDALVPEWKCKRLADKWRGNIFPDATRAEETQKAWVRVVYVGVFITALKIWSFGSNSGSFYGIHRNKSMDGSTYVTMLSNRAVLCGRCDDSRPSRWPTHWFLGIIDSIDAGRGLSVGSLDTFSVLDLEVLPVFSNNSIPKFLPCRVKIPAAARQPRTCMDNWGFRFERGHHIGWASWAS
jgi:hypothetical protein